MNISPDEAEEALADIQKVTQKTRHSIASGGAYIFLVITGAIWLVGFLATQFLSGDIVRKIGHFDSARIESRDIFHLN